MTPRQARKTIHTLKGNGNVPGAFGTFKPKGDNQEYILRQASHPTGKTKKAKARGYMGNVARTKAGA